MSLLVAMGATMTCAFGAAPSTLVVIPEGIPVSATGPLAANIMAHIPIVNIPPFGMCNTPSNPTVAAATAAAMGVLTPMPCVPVTAAPWVPGAPTILINGQPALNQTSMCMCTWGGVITITNPGQTKVLLSE